ncbi:MAG: 16S rRNA (cytosine(967)-C(5))-methyltransferase RsmB [Firmicutes bacterium]|nr:16S rRNA (cytosine(967)-C(5))-methyltransferase RsmB [Bacillota bacterium]
MRKHIDSAYKILSKVYQDGTYSNMAFLGERVSDMSTRLVYGTLEENVKIDYILSQLIEKKPQKSVLTLLKIGTYALLNLSDVPKFAIVSECVEVAKSNGKGGASGFINAVLKKVADGKYSLPKESDENYLSVTYSKPQWFCDKLEKQYGKEVARNILSAKSTTLEHIRINSRMATESDVEFLLKKNKTDFKKSDVGGYIVKANDAVRHMFDKGLVTFQSPSSILAVKALGVTDGAQILDICSAPGGKAVYMSELCTHGKVVACDLYPHRVALIQKYKNRMHTPNVKAVQADACLLNEEWKDAFDFVLCDAPCSCLGTFKKHPDVFLNKDESCISELAATQKQILENAAKYLKVGGAMMYSTCTLFEEENENVVHDFLEKNVDFVLEHISGLEKIDGGKYLDNKGMIQILPHDEYDGFFIAKIRRVK